MTILGKENKQISNLIKEAINEQKCYGYEIEKAWDQYISGDWGCVCKEDCISNNLAAENPNDLILAEYETSRGKIYITSYPPRVNTLISFATEI